MGINGRPTLEVFSWVAGILGFILALALALPSFLPSQHEKSSSKPVNLFLSKGEAFLRKNDLDSALFYFNQSTIENPKDEEGFYSLGLVYMMKKDFPIAIESFTKSIKLRPKYVDAFVKRATIYFDMKEFGIALSDINSAAKVEPDNVEVLNLNGLILDRLNNIAEAKEKFEKAIELDPNNPSIHYNLALTRARYFPFVQMIGSAWHSKLTTEVPKMHDSAIWNLNTAISYKANFTDAYFARGKIKLDNYYFYNSFVSHKAPNTNMYDEAITDFTHTIEMDTNFSEAYFFRGIAKSLKGESISASEDFKKAKQMGLKLDSKVSNISNLSHIGNDYLSSYILYKNQVANF